MNVTPVMPFEAENDPERDERHRENRRELVRSLPGHARSAVDLAMLSALLGLDTELDEAVGSSLKRQRQLADARDEVDRLQF